MSIKGNIGRIWHLGNHGQAHTWLRRAHKFGIASAAAGGAINHYEVPVSNVDPATVLALCLLVLPLATVANLAVFIKESGKVGNLGSGIKARIAAFQEKRAEKAAAKAKAAEEAKTETDDAPAGAAGTGKAADAEKTKNPHDLMRQIDARLKARYFRDVGDLAAELLNVAEEITEESVKAMYEQFAEKAVQEAGKYQVEFRAQWDIIRDEHASSDAKHKAAEKIREMAPEDGDYRKVLDLKLAHMISDTVVVGSPEFEEAVAAINEIEWTLGVTMKEGDESFVLDLGFEDMTIDAETGDMVSIEDAKTRASQLPGIDVSGLIHRLRNEKLDVEERVDAGLIIIMGVGDDIKPATDDPAVLKSVGERLTSLLAEARVDKALLGNDRSDRVVAALAYMLSKSILAVKITNPLSLKFN